jgi:hypothetical protein
MDTNRDFSELLSALNSAKVRYLLVGAHAVAYYAEPRYTKDLDVWVEATPENAARVWEALLKFGAPLKGSTPADFADERKVFQMGVEPQRVDILMGIDGVTFATAWENRRPTTYGGVSTFVLGLKDLVRNKQTSGRPQDLLDLKRLRARRAAPVRPKRKRRT